MSVATARRLLGRTPDGWWLAAAVLVAEALLVVGYFGATGARPTDPRYVVYPFVWINLGVWALVRTRPSPTTRPRRLAAALLAGGYFLLLAWLSGLVDPPTLLGAATAHAHAHGADHSHAHLTGWQFTPSAPGWGPRVAYVGHTGHVYFVPYLAVGYLGLAYLVYARLLEASAAALPGVVGVVSCLGCSFPVLASLSAGGSTAALAAAALSFDVSTAAYVLAVALLAGAGALAGGWET
ncbi:DUF7546 family protein [Halomarina ordinaria]|uniref:Uncharacterized protein n=1 Tax=Halomarina ordinaria TaxID=3033939 RepID=A0ABD5U393_9EURY|nr:hypothetical protein [Halomarina sp. PSRA2]